MPYVRKNGVWPVGEDWLFRVMSDTYLPLARTLERLENEGLTRCVALTMTPVLCEQLGDPYIKERFTAHLRTMMERCEGDMHDFRYFGDERRLALAESYRRSLENKLVDYLALDADLIGAFRSLEDRGVLETVASAATHPFLPAHTDLRSVKNQILLGLESHRRHFGRDPDGFWIPECAYRKGIETLLEAEGVRYFFVDASAVPGLPSTCPYAAGDSAVTALVLSERARLNVWDERAGYPTGGSYLDSTKYYERSGLHYWSVSGPGVPIEEKSVYEPVRAEGRVLEDSKHFVDDAVREIAEATPCSGLARPVVFAGYDTELFGHGWREGIYWLEVTLRSLGAGDSVRLTLPGTYLSENPPGKAVSLKETTWGTGRDHSTWVNERTEWMWAELRRAQERLFALAGRLRCEGGETSRALSQALREVMLLESSDWPYMVAKGRADEYATQRFNAHLERFNATAEALERGELERLIPQLSEVEDADNIFAELDLGVVSGG